MNKKTKIAIASSWLIAVMIILVLIIRSESDPGTPSIAIPLPSDVTAPQADPPPYNAELNAEVMWKNLVTPDELVAVKKTLGTTTPQVLNDRYSLFVIRAGDSFPDTRYEEPVVYFDDGVAESGEYKGYHRIFTQVNFGGEIGPAGYMTFITDDFKKFIILSDRKGVVPSPNSFNTDKVVAVADLPESFPETIKLNDVYDLRRDDYVTASLLANSIGLGTDLPGYAIFAEPNSYNKIALDYIANDTTVIVRDRAGIGFRYYLSFAAKTPNLPENAYEGNLQVKPSAPGFFSTYGRLFPHGCTGEDSSVSYTVRGIADSDLRDTGIAWKGVELFVLLNKDHPLIRDAYDEKVKNEGAIYSYAHGGSGTIYLASSTLEAYAEKNPVLFFRDPWGRWVAVGEQQYELPGGCGKPVIYLYPTEPTRVSVSFEHVPTFKKDIPTYSHGWKVLARPDGALQDLQSEMTDCDTIDVSFGSEYAKSACEIGIYPYLYWSGETDAPYPVPTGGWIVARGDIGSFLDSKLQLIGLNEKEKQDMLSYWVPELLKKESPYYRLSFFQTREMNKFIPMDIEPRPSSVLRVFLDWTPLAGMPSQLPIPQILHSFERKGFTVVEWGGLKQ